MLMQEKTVIPYLSEEELEDLREMSLGERVHYLREKMNEVFQGKYSIKKVTKRISERGVSVTPMALYHLESDKIQSPKSFFLMGVAQELGVSVEFLLLGPKETEDDDEIDAKLKKVLKDPSIRSIALSASQQLTEEGKQVILQMVQKAGKLARGEVTS